MIIDEIKKQFKDINRFNKIFELSKKSRARFQRLEFLGDRVLGVALAYKLYSKHQTYNEGKMAKLYAYLTSTKALSKIAKEIKLHQQLKINGIKNITNNVLADYLEAILAAYFLEKGYSKTIKLIIKLYDKEIEREDYVMEDFKSILQEWSQGNDYGLPTYRLINKKGPAHEPFFFVEVLVSEYNAVLGKGKSIQSAQQSAARRFMKKKIKHDTK